MEQLELMELAEFPADACDAPHVTSTGGQRSLPLRANAAINEGGNRC
jgi:hypothetical protein